MDPIKFPEANFTWKGNGEDVRDLPAYKEPNRTICCWKMNWRERFRAFWTGVMWVWVEGQIFLPILLDTNRPDFPENAPKHAAVCPIQLASAKTEEERNHVTHWTDKETCSYCGSISPHFFFACIAKGIELTPTAYDDTVEIKWDDDSTSKFFFQHLTPKEQWKFIDLLNKKEINIGGPGHFPVLPFFIRNKKKGLNKV